MRKRKKQPRKKKRILNAWGEFRHGVVSFKIITNSICDLLESEIFQQLAEEAQNSLAKAFIDCEGKREEFIRDEKTSAEIEEAVCANCEKEMEEEKHYTQGLMTCSEECSDKLREKIYSERQKEAEEELKRRREDRKQGGRNE